MSRSFGFTCRKLATVAELPFRTWLLPGPTRVRGELQQPGGNATMTFKMFAFAAAAIPIFLFVRSMLVRRPARINEGYKEFKKQSDLAVSIFCSSLDVS
jgi:hypothetical protein